MTQGRGGWTLDLRCFTCGAEDRFHGVLLSLAIDLAERAGWMVGPAPLMAGAPREETCAKCTNALRG